MFSTISGAPACPIYFPRAPVSDRAALGHCWSRRLLSLGAVGATRFRLSSRSRFPGPRANLDEQIPRLSRRERRHPGACDVCWPRDGHCRPGRAGAGDAAELTEIAPFTASLASRPRSSCRGHRVHLNRPGPRVQRPSIRQCLLNLLVDRSVCFRPKRWAMSRCAIVLSRNVG